MLLWERFMRTVLVLLRLPSLCGRAALLQKVVLKDASYDYFLQDLAATCYCNHQYKVQPEASQWCTPGLLGYLHWGLKLFNIFIKEMDKETQYIWRRYKTWRLIEEMGVLPLRGTWTA